MQLLNACGQEWVVVSPIESRESNQIKAVYPGLFWSKELSRTEFQGSYSSNTKKSAEIAASRDSILIESCD